MLGEIIGGWEGWTRIGLGEWSEKFFNRSPLTLKFEAEKLERESQARERERERARARSKASELLSFYARKLLFYLCKFGILSL